MRANRLIDRPLPGVKGQISFGRLVAQMRAAGELRNDEVLTHLEIDVAHGLIRYRLEKR